VGNVAECQLEVGEQAAASGQGDGHAAEFANKLLPGGKGGAAFATDLAENEQEALVAMRGEFDGHADGVKRPAK
jgi:hypothetical protein